jgi:hypothetical protein
MVQQDSVKQDLDRRLEGIAWALFLIMIGGLLLLPSVAGGVWLIGAGLIMIGLNVTRYASGIPIRTFSAALGGLAVLVGLADFAGLDLPLIPIIVILIGANLLFKGLTERN